MSNTNRFTYRLRNNANCRTFEIGELNNPRTSPDEWCDRRLCEGFWGDESLCKSVVFTLNEHFRNQFIPIKTDEEIRKEKQKTCNHKNVRENISGGRFDECLDCGKTWG